MQASDGQDPTGISRPRPLVFGAASDPLSIAAITWCTLLAGALATVGLQNLDASGSVITNASPRSGAVEDDVLTDA